ncbi:transmembrane protein 107 isoform X3 [Latimeria chalumnae]|uniref:transmembrane protein 107 isoform X3 n=1 Tax=Latimeria chalumnae TaxID=7897 RepID=UPI00313BC3C9
MPVVNSLVPARFLTLIAHLVIVITIFWSRESNVLACLPPNFTQQEYQSRDVEMIVALSVTLGLFAIELSGFLSGVSMFNSTQSLILPLWPSSSSCLSSGLAASTGGYSVSAALCQLASRFSFSSVCLP